MRIPIGVVEIILRMVEEKHLADHKDKYWTVVETIDNIKDGTFLYKNPHIPKYKHWLNNLDTINRNCRINYGLY